MTEKIGSFSGKWLVKELSKKFGYEKIRQKGSHVRLRRGNKKLTIPLQRELAKGIRDGILKEVAEHTGLTIEEVVGKLKK